LDNYDLLSDMLGYSLPGEPTSVAITAPAQVDQHPEVIGGEEAARLNVYDGVLLDAPARPHEDAVAVGAQAARA
jgi:hypothetical protein